jgi:hypothetical protein
MADGAMADGLYRLAAEIVCPGGVWEEEQARILGLPPVLRTAYTLILMDSEVFNGGLMQWLTNRSGRLVALTLEDLRRIEAKPWVHLIQAVSQLNDELAAKHPEWAERFEELRPAVCGESSACDADIENNYEPELTRVTREYFKLADSVPLWGYFAKFVYGS